MKTDSNNVNTVNKADFLNMPTPDLRQIVRQRKTPAAGVFLADGNRRLVMTQTRLEPGTDAFYQSYLTIVTGYFMKNLETFFEHGVNTMFFPLFGQSLLERDERFKQSVLPGLTSILFSSEPWQQFYRRLDIRVKVYGSPQKLEHAFPGKQLPQQIAQAVQSTAGHKSHTLYYGFFSVPWLVSDPQMLQRVNRFAAAHGREPDRNQLIQLYYGETVPPADFFINSTRISGLGALPPLICGKETKIYTLTAPAIYALGRETFREILYDLLVCRQPPQQGEPGEETIDALNDFYTANRFTVTGIGKRIGDYWVMET